MGEFELLMIDLETMGGPPNGAIIAVGACFFDIKRGKIGPKYIRKIHLATAVREGGVIDPATVLWWMRQGDEARREATIDSYDIDVVLTDFYWWIASHCRIEDVKVYGNGATFDLIILRTAYERLGYEPPWHWSAERCFRTLRKNYPSVEYDPLQKGDQAHNALVDVEFQARHLLRIASSLRVKN